MCDKNEKLEVLQSLVELLNETIKLDPTAINQLIDFHTPTNNDIADHPHIMVGETFHQDDTIDHYNLGMLGLLNGLTDKYGYRLVASYHNKDLIKFELVSVEEYNNRVATIPKL